MFEIMNGVKEKFNEFINEGKNDLKKIKEPKDLAKQIPNLFTLSRLFLIPFIVGNILSGNLITAGLISLGASATDFLDGKVARALDASSTFGAKLDAVVDKIFITTVTIPLFITNPYLIIPVLLDMAIASINGYAHVLGIQTETSMIGKIKTVFLDSLICSVFFTKFKVIDNISKALYFSTIALQLKTAKDYYKSYIKKDLNNLDGSTLPKNEESLKLDDEETKTVELEKTKNIKLEDSKSSELESLMELKKELQKTKDNNEQVIEPNKIKVKKNDIF